MFFFRISRKILNSWCMYNRVHSSELKASKPAYIQTTMNFELLLRNYEKKINISFES